MIQRHLEAFLAEHPGLPRYVEEEFRYYLDCGILGKGWAHTGQVLPSSPNAVRRLKRGTHDKTSIDMPDNLLKRLQAGETAALAELRSKLFSRVESVCRHIVHDKHAANEIAEDIFTDFAVCHVHRLQRAESVAAYLRMMAVRRACRWRDRAGRLERVPEDVSFSDGSGAGLVTLSEEKSLVDRLTLCLSRLQKRSRRVVRMRFRHEMTQEAIGEALGISKQHAGRVIAQALEGLRRCMESEP